MSRKRQIDPDFWTSEQVVTLSIEARLLFLGMISHADDEGRLKGSPLYLKVSIFPADKCSLEDVKEWRDAIVANNLAVYYENGSACYLHLPTFRKYQYMTKTFKSKLPIPPQVITSEQPVNNKDDTKEQQSYGIGIGIGIGNEVEVEVGVNKKLLNKLLTLKGWGTTHLKEDTEWLSEFLTDYPEFNESHIKACRDYHSDKSKHTVGQWKSRLRNWMVKAKEIREGRDVKNESRGRYGADSKGNQGLTRDEQRHRSIGAPIK